jgi:hypothetical protein
MDCQLATTDGKTFTCTACGRTHTLRPHERTPLHLRCGLTVHEPNTPRPPMPPLSKRAWNLANALASFVADGCKTVSKEEYEARLTVCDTCNLRNGEWCAHSGCGCYRKIKAAGRAWKCPAGKWPSDPPTTGP